jgi:hypothetical protein
MYRKPLDQGTLDGFCGLYAICNALTLLFPSTMTEDMQGRLFKVIALACKNKFPEIIWDGTTPHDVREMLCAAENCLHKTFSWEQPFAHEKFHNFDEFQKEIRWRIEGDDCFAVVGLSKPWEHWSCAHRLTDREMIMTDSCKVKQIALSKCGLTGDGVDYEFDYKDTFTLTRTVYNAPDH